MSERSPTFPFGLVTDLDQDRTYVNSPWMDTQQASVYCGKSRSSFEHLRMNGGGPRFTTCGRLVKYHVVWLDEWLGR